MTDNDELLILMSKLGSVRGILEHLNEDPFNKHPNLKGSLENDIEALKEIREFLIEEEIEE